MSLLSFYLGTASVYLPCYTLPMMASYARVCMCARAHCHEGRGAREPLHASGPRWKDCCHCAVQRHEQLDGPARHEMSGKALPGSILPAAHKQTHPPRSFERTNSSSVSLIPSAPAPALALATSNTRTSTNPLARSPWRLQHKPQRELTRLVPLTWYLVLIDANHQLALYH